LPGARESRRRRAGVGRPELMGGGASDDVGALRERVRVLAAGLGVDEAFEVSPEVRRHAAAGETLKAVSDLRRQTRWRLGLRAAKRMVDALDH